MQNQALHKQPEVIAACAAVLARMDKELKSFKLGIIVTDDGFEVTSTGADTRSSRLSSMTSSLQALSEAVCREMHLAETEYTVISSSNGHIIQLRIPGRQLVMCILFDHAETTGRALYAARNAANEITLRINREAA